MDLFTDVAALTRTLVDIQSVSRDEQPITDEVESALRALPHLTVVRDGNNLVARTDLGRSERVVLAGHSDTVPVNGNWPSRTEDDTLWGLGTCDMKGGLAVLLHLAATVPEPSRDVTYVMYDCEEIDASLNGLKRLVENRPELLTADFAVLMEPTGAAVEGGCQGTITIEVTVTGARAHTARAWMGSNAIHAAKPVIDLLTAYEPAQPVVDGITYHEGLNAVFAQAGIARNVVPDSCVITVNHRFAPDKSAAEAEAALRLLFDGYQVEVIDVSESARPGLGHPAAAAFVQATTGHPDVATAVAKGDVRAKLGWTDVARFSALGIPAVNYGPGDPTLAHHKDEHVSIESIFSCERRMRAWLA
jgi:succinyl-diaminopimelate desuccinylase